MKTYIAAALMLAAPLVAVPVLAQNTTTNARQNWSQTVTIEDGGHVVGNPDAATRIVEFMSYTCSHCADFAREGEPAIKLAVVPSGHFAFEIRHLLRDPVDLTAALLAQCGDTDKFVQNHAAIMARFDDWMGAARRATQAQQSRWYFGSHSARRRAIASDLGFYSIMEGRGYTRPQIDRCLSDDVKAEALVRQSQVDTEKHGLRGTPSFVVDGELLDGVHDWAGLEPVLRRIDMARREAR